jgi:cytochrome c
MSRFFWPAALGVSLALGVATTAASFLLVDQTLAQNAAPEHPAYNAQGEIRLPADYRAKWAHLGSWVVMDSKAPGHGFHDVYTQPETVAEFRKTGKFPDGATLIKEIRTLAADDLTTGKAVWADKPAVWFVMVKDTQGRFKQSKLWGEGWGWALFKADAPAKNVATDFRQDCIDCHTPAKGDDWVFVRGYPTLKK